VKRTINIPGVFACARSLGLTFAAIATAFALSAPALAQNDKMVPIPTPPQADAIVLGTGPLPGATAKESWHRQYEKSFARNVTIATLMPFLPDPAKASGAAVIVAPGGGFRTLSMENEGSDVARALAARGSRHSFSSTGSFRHRRTWGRSNGRWRRCSRVRRGRERDQASWSRRWRLS
jgi:acetyl esterase/lipase